MSHKPLVVKGKLKFKGEFQDKMDKHKEEILQRKQREAEAKQYEQLFKQKPVVPQTTTQFPVQKGTGKVATSGRSVHGADTCFKTQLQKGDIIILTHPVLGTKQQKTICLILSDKSILLTEPFVEEQPQFGPFEFKKKTLVKPAEDIEEDYKKRLQEIHRTKKIQKQKSTVDVRTKKGIWSYQVKKVEVDKQTSRQDLLNMRMKMGKDKHCW